MTRVSAQGRRRAWWAVALACVLFANAFTPRLIEAASPTSMVKDINPGADGSAAGTLLEMDGKLYFGANDGVHGYELWVSDGTAAGTKMVKDTLPGSESGVERVYLTHDGYVYFSATDQAHGTELWRSDGSATGTALFKDIFPGEASSWPDFLTVAGDKFYFEAADLDGRELWVSDGTSSGTVQVKDIWTGFQGSDPLHQSVVLGEQLLFTANDDVSGEELWITDGTSIGTVLVKDIKDGAQGSYPGGFIAFGGQVFFRATDGISGSELWRTDGTEAGTQLVKDIRAGASSSSPQSLNVLGSLLIFAANDGVHGYEMWRSNGTEEGTNLIQEIQVGAFGSGIVPQGILGGELLFGADAGRGAGMWVTDGYEVDLVREYVHAANQFTSFLGYGFFDAYDEDHGMELWRTDGTAKGTQLVRDIRYENAPLDSGDLNGSLPRSLTVMGDQLYFFAKDDSHGYELWRTTGEIDDPCGVISMTVCPTIRDDAPGNVVGAPGTNSYLALATYSWYRCRSAGLATASRMIPRGCTLATKVISSGPRMASRPYRVSPVDRSWGYLRLRVQVSGKSYFSGTYDLR